MPRREPHAGVVLGLGGVEFAGEGQRRGQVEAEAGIVRHHRHGVAERLDRPVVAIGLGVDDAERVERQRILRAERQRAVGGEHRLAEHPPGRQATGELRQVVRPLRA
jgi:hypothetical protein